MNKKSAIEVIAKPLGTPAFRRQSPEKCGHYVRNPAKPEGFAITSIIFFIVAIGSICSCGSRQTLPESSPAILEQSAEQPAAQEPTAAEQAPSRAEQVIKALSKAYPNQIEGVEFRNDDWALLMRGTWYYYADARMLPENLREKATEYRSMLFYRYPAELPSWVEPSPEESARLGNIRPNRSRETPRRSTFIDDLWQARNHAEASNNTRTITFLGKSARVHHLIIESLSLVEARILSAAKNDPQIQAWINSISISESWAWRNIAETQARSFHSYGIALDLLPKSLGGKQTYWLWTSQHRKDWWNVSYDERYHPPAAVISAFEANGFIWGGKWLRFDTMHFEYRQEVLILNGVPYEM